MKLERNAEARDPSPALFASRFLSEAPVMEVPDGYYDPERQLFIREDDETPAYTHEGLFATAGGNEITTHYVTSISGASFTDTDNG